MGQKLNLAVLISGRGSNLQSILEACQDPAFPAQVKLVISNKADAYGLVRAEKMGIPTGVVAHKDFSSREEFERALITAIETAGPIDLVCLAGFMRVLTPLFIARWENRLINIHPSLLPAYKGLHTHERAIAAGEKIAGCTIHFVTSGVDEGPIILQKSVPVLPNDTPDSLAERVLEQEHLAYPEAISLLAQKNPF
ncbi:MAG: phosphoribosylglycinamide formyltransferase [Alphaproteobacteria bacterium]|jgi:phosphoribosylglycinamide formyltransferase-1|nr:phosphoribosylglycinamide formyltransferase [Alphaproteobacteria bacterium]MBP9867811.1 phosphoribosylglycinamide formyltransferase [Alphaproteobacteria bacterium]